MTAFARLLLAAALAATLAVPGARATPLGCLLPQGAGASDATPFTAGLLTGDGELDALRAATKVRPESFVTQVDAQLYHQLYNCLGRLDQGASIGEIRRYRLILAVLAAGMLRDAASAGDAAAMRQAAVVLRRTLAWFQGHGNIQPDEFTLLSSASRLTNRVAPPRAETGQAGALSLISEVMARTIRPGAEIGSPFSNYLEALNAPHHEALRLIANARIQEQRDKALRNRVLSSGGGAVAEDAPLRKDELSLVTRAIEPLGQTVVKAQPLEPNPSSFTHLRDLRELLDELETEYAPLDADDVCFHYAGTEAANCTAIERSTVAGRVLAPFDMAYPSEGLAQLVPLRAMDDDLRRLFHLLGITPTSGGGTQAGLQPLPFEKDTNSPKLPDDAVAGAETVVLPCSMDRRAEVEGVQHGTLSALRERLLSDAARVTGPDAARTWDYAALCGVAGSVFRALGKAEAAQ